MPPRHAEEDARRPVHGTPTGDRRLSGRLLPRRALPRSLGPLRRPPRERRPRRRSPSGPGSPRTPRPRGASASAGRSVSSFGRAPRMSCSARRAIRSTRRNLLSTPSGIDLDHLSQTPSNGSLCGCARGSCAWRAGVRRVARTTDSNSRVARFEVIIHDNVLKLLGLLDLLGGVDEPFPDRVLAVEPPAAAAAPRAPRPRTGR